MFGLPLGMVVQPQGDRQVEVARDPPRPLHCDHDGRMAPLQKCQTPARAVSAPSPLPFGCVEELRLLLAARGLELQLTQLAGGLLRGDLLALRLGELGLLRIRLDRPLHARGAKDPRQQLICLDLTPPQRAGPCRSHGQLLPATAVYGLARSGEVHLTLPARTDLALLLLPLESFHRRRLQLGVEALEERVLARNWLQLDPQRFTDLALTLRRLCAAALHHPAQAALLERDLWPLLLEALAQAAGLGPRLLRPPARIELVKATQRWLDDHPDQPLTLEDLCRVVYGSRRSLIQGFRDHLGMGPMAYLKLQRLHGARRSLLRADPAGATVLAVATHHGFLNPGHFARDYRRLFGEPPSASLQRGTGASGLAFNPAPAPASAPPPGRSG